MDRVPSIETLVVVLGSPNDAAGNLSSMARERLTAGSEEYFAERSARILLTGGFGEHFNTSPLPHAEHARKFLLAADIPEGAFCDFALSKNTIEDALLARPIVEALAPEGLIVVTSDFHLERAGYVFGRVFPTWEARCVGAPHAAPDAVRRRLEAHEARALAGLRAARGTDDDPLRAAAPPP